VARSKLIGERSFIRVPARGTCFLSKQHIRVEVNMRFDLENLPLDTAPLLRLVREMATAVDSRDGEIERLEANPQPG
jgi:hypothetical protein